MLLLGTWVPLAAEVTNRYQIMSTVDTTSVEGFGHPQQGRAGDMDNLRGARAAPFYWALAMSELAKLGQVTDDDEAMATADDDALLVWPDDMRDRLGVCFEDFTEHLRRFRFVRGHDDGSCSNYSSHRNSLIKQAESGSPDQPGSGAPTDLTRPG